MIPSAPDLNPDDEIYQLREEVRALSYEVAALTRTQREMQDIAAERAKRLDTLQELIQACKVFDEFRHVFYDVLSKQEGENAKGKI